MQNSCLFIHCVPGLTQQQNILQGNDVVVLLRERTWRTFLLNTMCHRSSLANLDLPSLHCMVVFGWTRLYSLFCFFFHCQKLWIFSITLVELPSKLSRYSADYWQVGEMAPWYLVPKVSWIQPSSAMQWKHGKGEKENMSSGSVCLFVQWKMFLSSPSFVLCQTTFSDIKTLCNFYQNKIIYILFTGKQFCVIVRQTVGFQTGIICLQ